MEYITVTYPGQGNKELDAAIEKAAGVKRFSSGTCCLRNWVRDITFEYASAVEAAHASKRIEAIAGVAVAPGKFKWPEP